MQLFALVVLLLAGVVPWGCGGWQRYSDLSALSELRKGIDEDPQGRLLDSWNPVKASESDGCPVNWYGVQCMEGHVVSIMLDGMGLVGTVDFSVLAGMQGLRNFSVSNNHFSGVLPRRIGSLGSLQFLDLSNNSFSGSLPSELTKLDGLVYLNLSLNKFEGMLPGGLGNLRELKYLDLHSNGFSGEMSFLAELQGAIYVDLSGNKFSGSLSMLTRNSTLTGSVEYLNVSGDMLPGQLFVNEIMLTFDSLEVFDASENHLSGKIPPFQFVVSLRILRLASNNFSGSLPEALFRESSMVLAELDLSNNQLEGPVGRITSTTLKHLNLSANKLVGSLPLRVGSCSVVDMSNNRFSGNISAIRYWGNYVEVIDLSSNFLTGSFPNETSFLRLNSLKVSNNLLAGELPPVIGSYPELSVVDFSGNQLYGPVLPSLFTSFRLAELNLSGNHFTGSIPFPSSKRKTPSMSSIVPLFLQNTSLASLDLSKNSLSGTLSSEISALKELRIFKIGGNNISGVIPREIGTLNSLLYLDLSMNHLEGTIPGNLPRGLISFNVSYNELSGTVPLNLMKFPESSFHPGNALLVFPQAPSNSPSSSRSGAHVHHTKALVRYILIVGIIGTASIMVLLSILLYVRASYGRVQRDRGDKQIPPEAHSIQTQKNGDAPSNQSSQHSCSPSPLPGHGGALSVSTGSPLHGIMEEVSKEPSNNATGISPPKDGSKSPKSFHLSPSHVAEQPPVLRVCSPDKLAGDLHLFDHSFEFTAEELSRAPAEIIGRSCHGTSYKATLDSEHIVTVKWLREGISKGRKDFSREAKKLGNIRHPNIVSLKGYYWGPKDRERLIISDYINAVSVTAHLCEFETRKLVPLSLPQRLSIAIDVARGLNYLHNERSIPHGNLKSTNVILQLPTLNALLTDYSLHRIMTSAGMADQVLNAGALGYRPPEFANMSKPCPSLKSDVYAFGVILLELLTGKGAGEIVSSNPGVVDLTDWVRLLACENRSSECFDIAICGGEAPPNHKLLEGMLQVALRCIRSASERPEIKTAFEDLSSMAAAVATEAAASS